MGEPRTTIGGVNLPAALRPGLWIHAPTEVGPISAVRAGSSH
jgi:hypothetical protein